MVGNQSGTPAGPVGITLPHSLHKALPQLHLCCVEEAATSWEAFPIVIPCPLCKSDAWAWRIGEKDHVWFASPALPPPPEEEP